MTRTCLGDRLALGLGDEEVHLHILKVPEGKEGEISRYFIQSLASFYLKRDPSTLEFHCGEKGKPFLAKTDLRFNLSHTGGLIACSFAKREVGIDVEKTDTSPCGRDRYRLLAQRFFSRKERQYLQSRRSENWPLEFLRIFTRKEAYIKACGKGLSLPFTQFTVPLSVEEVSRLHPWEFAGSSECLAGYCLSLVVENSEGKKLHYRHQFYEWDGMASDGFSTSEGCSEGYFLRVS